MAVYVLIIERGDLVLLLCWVMVYYYFKHCVYSIQSMTLNYRKCCTVSGLLAAFASLSSIKVSGASQWPALSLDLVTFNNFQQINNSYPPQLGCYLYCEQMAAFRRNYYGLIWRRQQNSKNFLFSQQGLHEKYNPGNTT